MLQFEEALNTPGRSRGDCTIVSTLNELYSGDLFLELWNPKKLFIEVKKMNDFKVDDNAVCVDSGIYVSLTKGNIYSALEVRPTQIFIKNDDNSKAWYPKNLFTTVWKPKVGEPCIFNEVGEMPEITPKFVGDDHVVFMRNGVECVNNIKYFSPLKTTAEIEREECIEGIRKVLWQVSSTSEIDYANALYDAGYRKQQVKPLSYKDFSECTSGTNDWYCRIDKGFAIKGGE